MNDDITSPGPALGDDQGEMRERRTAGRSRRRRGASPTIVTISWRDIPAQLTARAGDDQYKVLLHARFQHAIDRAAAVAELTSTDLYVQEWRTSSSALGDGDVAAQLDQRCAQIEADFPRDRLERLVANGGLDPDATEPTTDSTPGSAGTDDSTESDLP